MLPIGSVTRRLPSWLQFKRSLLKVVCNGAALSRSAEEHSSVFGMSVGGRTQGMAGNHDASAHDLALGQGAGRLSRRGRDVSCALPGSFGDYRHSPRRSHRARSSRSCSLAERTPLWVGLPMTTPLGSPALAYHSPALAGARPRMGGGTPALTAASPPAGLPAPGSRGRGCWLSP